MENTTVMIVDDERAARFGMRGALNRENYKIIEAEDADSALEKIQQHSPDLVYLDLNMPGRNGMEALGDIQQLSSPPLVIVVTAYGSEKIAVEAMKKGAYDYLSKPYDVEELRMITRNALEKLNLIRENIRLKEEIRLKECFGEIIGESQAMQQVYDLIEKVAHTNVPVLITGESGTGKELVAREVQLRSSRSKESFIPVNCAAVPENLIESELFGTERGAFTGARERKGKLEEANKGTLFLDEIGDMGLDMQAKILRVLNDQIFERLGGNAPIKTDIRLIAATNKDLEQEIKEENFRDDLYYRIKVVDIDVPPLREREGDIPLLVNHFIKLFAKKHGKQITGITPGAMLKMVEYSWPGNVRELKNTIEKMVVLSSDSQISEKDLPFNTTGTPPKRSSSPEHGNDPNFSRLLASCLDSDILFKDAKKAFVREFEKHFIIHSLKKHKGIITQTAQTLGMPRQSLQQKLKELGINAREFVQTNS